MTVTNEARSEWYQSYEPKSSAKRQNVQIKQKNNGKQHHKKPNTECLQQKKFSNWHFYNCDLLKYIPKLAKRSSTRHDKEYGIRLSVDACCMHKLSCCRTVADWTYTTCVHTFIGYCLFVVSLLLHTILHLQHIGTRALSTPNKVRIELSIVQTNRQLHNTKRTSHYNSFIQLIHMPCYIELQKFWDQKINLLSYVICDIHWTRNI